MPKQPPRSLWTDRDDDAHERWIDPDTAQPANPRAPRSTRPQPKRRVTLRRVAAGAGVTVIAVGGVALGQRIGADEQVATSNGTTITLPVVKGKTEETRANEIYSQIKSGVVQIKTSDGSGTGFVVDKTGTIVTNAHVVSGSKTVKVYFDDSTTGITGTVTGTDISTDLAAVKVNPKQAKLVPLALADSDDVEPGDQVLAIGYPLGLDRTLTEGIVSGLGRQIQAQNNFSIDKVIQTDASINPGNSGGPLIDSRGRVIGVNSQIATSAAGSNTGIGFAIPSNTVRTVIPKLAAGQTVKHAFLGASLGDSQSGNGGAQVAQLTSDGPGERAGLQTGDVVTAINGKKIASADELVSAIGALSAGQTAELTVQRSGETKKVKVTLGERPNTTSTTESQSQSVPDSGGSGSGGLDPSDPSSGGQSQGPDGSGGQGQDGSGVSPFQIP
ncbi:MAG: trypsin-like peptidase domain-containing protein [Patulibacter sp.]